MLAASTAAAAFLEYTPHLFSRTSRPIAAPRLHRAGKAAMTADEVPCKKVSSVYVCMYVLQHGELEEGDPEAKDRPTLEWTAK